MLCLILVLYLVSFVLPVISESAPHSEYGPNFSGTHSKEIFGGEWGCLLTVLTCGFFIPVWLLIDVLGLALFLTGVRFVEGKETAR